MKKIFVFIVISLITTPIFSQFYTSYSTNNFWTFGADFSSIFQSKKIHYGFDFSVNCNTKTKGKYYSNINFGEFPEDHQKKITYNSHTLNGFIGYEIFEKTIFSLILGYGQNVTSINCYDKHHILGNNGEYFISNRNKYLFNYGISANIGINDYFTLDLGVRKIEGVTFGFSVTFFRAINKKWEEYMENKYSFY